MNIDYSCADCQLSFSISVTDDEMRTFLNSTHAEQCLILCNRQAQRALAFHYGTAPEVQCLSVMACILWALGDVEQAVKRSHKACELAEELAHPRVRSMPCTGRLASMCLVEMCSRPRSALRPRSLSRPSKG